MTHLEVIQKVWPEWTVTEKIGEGSFGQVFKAEKESFKIKQESAIKVVRIPESEAQLDRARTSLGVYDDEGLREYFRPQLDKLKNEIELMMKFDDNNIVKIHDFDIRESIDSKISWYILIRMELLECLEKYIKEADMTVGEVVSIGEDILSCLETCEENNIIHRDIKPANIFRNDKGVYKLGDFGIARDMRAEQGELSHKGTENYMAPEVYMRKNYNFSIDIYALGIVLYKLLNKNRLPFMSQEKLSATSVEKAFQRRNDGEDFPNPIQAPNKLYEVIKKMCAYKPEDRFKTAVEAKKALTEYKEEAGEELDTILDVGNRLRKAVDVKMEYEEPEKSIMSKDLLMQNRHETKTTEDDIYEEFEELSEGFEELTLEMDEVDTASSRESIQNQIFNESYNKKAEDKELINRARSLYQEKDKTIPDESKTVDTLESVIEEDEEDERPKPKISVVIGIGLSAVVLIAAVLVLLFSGSNSSNVDVAKEIYADDSVFVIDKEQYKGKYVEYTATFLIGNELTERTGVYIGETKSGKPDGYGAFYYRREGIDEEGKYIKDVVSIGNWKKGILVADKETDTIKERVFSSKELNNGDKLTSKFIVEGAFGAKDFTGSDEKEYVNQQNNTALKTTFKGTFDEDYNFINGDYYIDDKLYYRGEFKDNDPYNGIFYDESGKEKGKIVNGKQ